MAQESTPPEAQNDCPDNTICLWTSNNFRGAPWEWSPRHGYRDLPNDLHDNVGSFRANADGIFIADGERRTVLSGDYRRNYRQDFGGRMDAITSS